MKKYAFFLPQFHSIKENDEWWGEGFTEWVNVKKAKKLYENHVQPITPLDNNYYCLLDKNTVEWQTSLMKKYCIDGLIYYHYYFCGDLLLEKPAENLLKWKDIDQPFFFCWANHSWYRSWNGTKELLKQQTYGGQEDWEKHFQYLIKFFSDSRYIKVNNRPIFVIYNPDFIEKNDMVEFLNRRCIDYGFDGVYIVETISDIHKFVNHSNDNPKLKSEYFFREPSLALSLLNDKRSFGEKVKRKLKRHFVKVFKNIKPDIFKRKTQ